MSEDRNRAMAKKFYMCSYTRCVMSRLKYQMIAQKALNLMTLYKAPGNTSKNCKKKQITKTKKVPYIKLAAS
jgi:hypothetical protein